MLRYKSVTLEEVIDSDKFEPRYHLFQEKLAIAMSKFRFLNLNDISEKITAGKTLANANYVSQSKESYPFIRTGDVKKYRISTQNLRYLDKNQTESLKKYQLVPGDVLISAIGNYLGSAAIVPISIAKSTFNQNSLRVRLRDDSISPELLTYFLNSKFGQEQIDSLHSRTGQKIINASVAGSILVPIIESDHFTQRIKYLDLLEEKAANLIIQAQNIVKEYFNFDLAEYDTSIFFDANLSQISAESMWTPEYSRPLYNKMLNHLEENFEMISISEVADIFDGDEIGTANYIGYLDSKYSDLSFIRTTDLVNFTADPYPDFYVDNSIAKDFNQEILANDILFTNDGKIGQVALVLPKNRIIVQSHINVVRVNKNALDLGITSQYLFTCLTIPEIAIYQARKYTVIQSTIPTLASFFSKFRIPIASKEIMEKVSELVVEATIHMTERFEMQRTLRSEIESLFD